MSEPDSALAPEYIPDALPDELCPRCGENPVDVRSFFGWCRSCSNGRPAALKSERQKRWKRGELDFAHDPLVKLENLIRSGLRTFMTVGMALKAIKDRRLYRDCGFSNFEDYCLGRWGFGRAYAYRQIQAAEFIGALTSEEVLPSGDILHEGHVRELQRLAPEDAREVWSELVATYPLKLITGEVVRAEVDRRVSGNGYRLTALAPEWWLRGC